MDWSAIVESRVANAGIRLAAEPMRRVTGYLELLAKWNRSINLTAFDLDKPTDDAIDRLIVEPLVASQAAAAADQLAVDLGSGGGSPGIPLSIARPSMSFRLVESIVKKVSFLRQVTRELGLSNVVVEHGRFQDLATRSDLAVSVDLVTLRAVRADSELWSTVDALLAPQGSVFWFGAESMDTTPPSGFRVAGRRTLIPGTGRVLVIVERG